MPGSAASSPAGAVCAARGVTDCTAKRQHQRAQQGPQGAAVPPPPSQDRRPWAQNRVSTVKSKLRVRS
jgi:hypothetical protein